MRSFPESLKTERLHLRPLQNGDAAALSAYRNLPEVARYQAWDSFDLETTTQFVAEQSEADFGIPGSWFQVALIETGANEFVGDCGLCCRPGEPAHVELGITLAPEHQKLGYATEAIRCVLDFLFNTMKKDQVSVVTDAENKAAIALFKRLGFREAAFLQEHVWFKGRWGSEYILQCTGRIGCRFAKPGT
jgi:RimJ/RimL family protein N-acetyltransferase